MRILPDGCLDVIWDGRSVLVAGPDTTANISSVVAGTRYVGVRFDPGVGPSALGIPAAEVADARIGLAEILGANEAERWTAALSGADDPDLTLESLSARALLGGAPVPGWVPHAVGILARGGSVATASARLGYSERQLHRLAQERFGYGLATLARVLRFQSALPALRRGADATTVAAATGYADASHLHRDVRSLSGVPVRELRVSTP